jgi:hypothetical protein
VEGVPFPGTGPLHLFFSSSYHARTTNFLVFVPGLSKKKKAFDIVSFTTINLVFAKFNWLERFRLLLSTVYCNIKSEPR